MLRMNERVSMASSYYRILEVSVGHRCCFVRSQGSGACYIRTALMKSIRWKIDRLLN